MYFKVSSSTYAILAVSKCLSIQGIICISSLFEGHPGHANVKESLYNFTQFFNAEKIGETQLLLEDMTEYSNVITGKRNLYLSNWFSCNVIKHWFSQIIWMFILNNQVISIFPKNRICRLTLESTFLPFSHNWNIFERNCFTSLILFIQSIICEMVLKYGQYKLSKGL